jgi:hypothetical protein
MGGAKRYPSIQQLRVMGIVAKSEDPTWPFHPSYDYPLILRSLAEAKRLEG